MRVRVKYSVKDKIRFISHLDLMRVFFRACIRKDIPVAVSQGYSPHLKLSFGPSLSVGMSSLCEYLDIYLKRQVSIESLNKDLQEGLPEGVRIEEIYSVSESEPSLSAIISGAEYSVKIPLKYSTDVKDRIQRFLERKSIIIERPSMKGRGKAIDIRPLVKELKLNDGCLFMSVVLGKKGSVRPLEVIRSLWLELETEEVKLWQVNREKLSPLEP